MINKSGSKKNVWRGVAAGVVGGMVASWTMNQFQVLVSKAADKGTQKARGESGGSATEKAADAISENVFQHHLTPSEKQVAAPAVHYAFGAVNGALYGALSELTPAAKFGSGTLFGALLWVVADEIGVPALKLSGPPTQYPISSHAEALASHLVYGITADAVRRAVLATT